MGDQLSFVTAWSLLEGRASCRVCEHQSLRLFRKVLDIKRSKCRDAEMSIGSAIRRSLKALARWGQKRFAKSSGTFAPSDRQAKSQCWSLKPDQRS